MTYHADNPGVRFPPPFIYAAAVLGGWLLDQAWPVPTGAFPGRTALAWLFFAGFGALLGSALGWFRRNRTSMLPFRPANTLVITGPYRFTRNPMYLGAVLLVLAFTLWLGTWWPAILLPAVIVIVQRYVIAREERYMRRRFGAAYDAYARRVRRWI